MQYSRKASLVRTVVSSTLIAFSCIGSIGAAILSNQSEVAAQDSLPVGWGWSMTDETLTIALDGYDEISDLEVEITPGRGAPLRFSRDRLTTNQRWNIDVPAPTSTTRYSIRVTGQVADLEGEFRDAFDVEVFEDLTFEVDTSTFNEAAHAFVMQMNQPADRVEVVVRGESGQLLAERVVEFNGEGAGSRLPINWSQGADKILTIDVKAVAVSGSWASKQYIPWKVEFAPVSINFATGSSEIPASDFGVLENRLGLIVTTADRVKEWVEVKLYVAGYTDTVGSPADNERLSEARARSLGLWFEQHGISFPIYYQGFGESALAVPTGDGVDEPQNRRSLFVLSTQPPPTDSNFPSGRWTELD